MYVVELSGPIWLFLCLSRVLDMHWCLIVACLVHAWRVTIPSAAATNTTNIATAAGTIAITKTHYTATAAETTTSHTTTTTANTNATDTNATATTMTTTTTTTTTNATATTNTSL